MGAVLAEDKAYFVSCDFNALFCMDLKKKQVEYKTYFTAHSKDRKELYDKHILHEKKIYFIPRMSERVAIYNLETERQSFIDVNIESAFRICDAFIEENYLWMLSEIYPAIVIKINLKTHHCEIINLNWKDIYSRLGVPIQSISDLEKQVMFSGAKRVGDFWWIFMFKHGNIVIYNWKTGEVETFSCARLKGKRTVGIVDNKIWLTSWEGDRILEYDCKRKTEKWINQPQIEKIFSHTLGIFEYGKYIFVIKQTGIMVVDKENYAVKWHEFLREKNLRCYIAYGNNLIFFPAVGRGLIVFRMLDNTIEEYEFKWEESLTYENFKKYFSCSLSECACGLEEYEKVVKKIEQPKSCQRQGQEIWKVLRCC